MDQNNIVDRQMVYNTLAAAKQLHARIMVNEEIDGWVASDARYDDFLVQLYEDASVLTRVNYADVRSIRLIRDDN